MDDSLLDSDLISGEIMVEDTPPRQSPESLTKSIVDRFSLQSQPVLGSETAANINTIPLSIKLASDFYQTADSSHLTWLTVSAICT